MLHLQRPLVFLDAESTGLDRENDRIISLAMYKVFSFGRHSADAVTMGETAKDTGRHSALVHWMINPQMPIPAASTEIHGITDADVANEPTFDAVAEEIQQFLADCDIAGFGSNYYDVPLLFNHFLRAGIYWQPGELIDVGNIFKINEPRTLSAAMRFYTGHELKDAHTAVGDVLATVEVFTAQMGRYELPDTVEALALYSNHGNRIADLSGKFYYDADNVVHFNFGPHKDQPALGHVDYLEWMYYRANFSLDTNRILLEMLTKASSVRPDADDSSDADDLFF